MKKYLLFVSSILLSVSMFAQGLDFTNQADVTYGDPFSEDIGSYFTVTNNSEIARSIKVRRNIINMDEQSTNWFCWVLCFDSTVDEGPYPITLQPGESTDEFSAHFNPNFVSSADWQMEYCFFDENDENFEYCTTVSFSTLSVGVNDVDKIEMGIPQPNPATDIVRISYNLKEVNSNQVSLAIFDVLGSEVMSSSVLGKEGTMELNVADLTPGVYIYSMRDAGAILSTGRLVVQ